MLIVGGAHESVISVRRLLVCLPSGLKLYPAFRIRNTGFRRHRNQVEEQSRWEVAQKLSRNLHANDVWKAADMYELIMRNLDKNFLTRKS
jgi:hypothetical protein